MHLRPHPLRGLLATLDSSFRWNDRGRSWCACRTTPPHWRAPTPLDSSFRWNDGALPRPLACLPSPWERGRG